MRILEKRLSVLEYAGELCRSMTTTYILRVRETTSFQISEISWKSLVHPLLQLC